MKSIRRSLVIVSWVNHVMRIADLSLSLMRCGHHGMIGYENILFVFICLTPQIVSVNQSHVLTHGFFLYSFTLNFICTS